MPIRGLTGLPCAKRKCSTRPGPSSIPTIICGIAAANAICSTSITSDIASGHNVVATVYVEARSMYRAKGPEAFRPVGEVEFANGAAAMSASGGYGSAAVCAGIVGHVNLLLGE